MKVTAEQLVKVVPAAAPRVAQLVDPLNAAMAEFGITTEQRIEMFVAQVAHETAGFSAFVENMNYSAQGLASTWDRYSATGKRGGPPNALALRLNRNPQAIANNVYANRLGNGDESSGDGWKYRGHGGLHTTGLDNFKAVSGALGVDYVGNPDLLMRPLDAFRSAAWFWKAHGLNEFADTGSFNGTTKVINGGDIGGKERIGLWTLAKVAIHE